MSLQVRLPGCSAMTTIGGTNETYIAVPVAQERSAPSAAPMIATPCGIRERAVRATAYRSPVFSATWARLAGMVEWSDNSAGPVRGAPRAAGGRWHVRSSFALRVSAIAIGMAVVVGCGGSAGSPPSPSQSGAAAGTPTPQPIKVRAAYGNVTPANLAPFYAKEKGLFLANGLDVDLSLIDGGGKAMAALLGNSVDIAQLGGTETMSAYVGGGDVQAVTLFVPVSPAQKVPAVENCTIVTKKYASEHKDVMQKYVDSLVQAIVAMKKDKPGTLPVMQKLLNVTDQDALSETYDYYVTQIFPIYPTVTQDAWNYSRDELAKTNAAVKGLDVTKVIDNSFVTNSQSRKVGG
ncbi:MAG: hypothetical protein E6I83_02615 [Chloroflexi bacterium]|nr:MAG: hypothetical protein E6I83_02615 [Chloroflexota bacterium]